MSQPIVIFDVGRVLIEWDMRIPFRSMMTEKQITQFLEETNLAGWNLRFDGGLSFQSGINELCAQFPHYADALHAFDERWVETTPQAIEGSLAILQLLKARNVALYAITNFSAEKWPIACERYPFLTDSFLDVVVSGHEGVVKPDAEIYNILLERNDLSPEDCIFIDDSARNVAGATALGIDGIVFTHPAQLARDLVNRAILPLEAAE
jgi:2-haloacid dehalogenase